MAAANAFERKLNVVSDKFNSSNLPFNPVTSTDGGGEIWLAWKNEERQQLPDFTTAKKMILDQATSSGCKVGLAINDEVKKWELRYSMLVNSVILNSYKSIVLSNSKQVTSQIKR